MFASDLGLFRDSPNMVAGSTVTSDGLACLNTVTYEKCLHEKIVCGGGRISVKEPKLYRVNTIPGNLKSTQRGIYDAIKPKNMLALNIDRFLDL